ncbi:NAD(P)/FAD-dependent oxidoreductase [Limosilactobacillus mucosae]
MKKIVILGAGYAGLKTVVELQKKVAKAAEITLVEQNDYHYEATNLHEVAAGNVAPERICFDIQDVLSPAVKLIKDRVVKVDPDAKQIELAEHAPLNYDYCVLALGFVSETFGIKGAVENSLPMANVDQAAQIADHLNEQMVQYHTDHNPDHLKIIVCGAGFTGIELAGALYDARKRLAKLAVVDPSTIQIKMIDASPRILPMFDDKMKDYAVKLMQKEQLTLQGQAAIKEIKPGAVVYQTKDEQLHEETAGTIIWTTGVSGSPVMAASDLPQRRGRVMVTDHLTAPKYDDLYVLGDVAAVMPPDGKRPYPTTAQIALTMGIYAAKDLAARVAGSQRPGPYSYHSLGTVASMGNTHAFGVAMGMKYYGYPASVIKKMIANKSLIETGGVKELLAKGRFDLYH